MCIENERQNTIQAPLGAAWVGFRAWRTQRLASFSVFSGQLHFLSLPVHAEGGLRILVCGVCILV